MPPDDQQSFGAAIGQLADNLEGLREFVEVIQHVLDGRKQEALKANARDLGPLLLVFDALGHPDVSVTEEQRDAIESEFGGVRVAGRGAPAEVLIQPTNRAA